MDPSLFNPLPHNDNFWRLLKTLWEKKKMLVTSIFFFSHNIFYSIEHTCNVLSSI